MSAPGRKVNAVFTIQVEVEDVEGGIVAPKSKRGMRIWAAAFAALDAVDVWKAYGGFILTMKNKQYLPDAKEIIDQTVAAKNQIHLGRLELERIENKRKGRERALRDGTIEPPKGQEG